MTWWPRCGKLKVPVVRWPGGCFADEYHWKDGIGPRDKRPSMINTYWGGVVENNHFGTHEFMDFCEQIGATPYICGNVGSGTVQEMMEWVEYITVRRRFADGQSAAPKRPRKAVETAVFWRWQRDRGDAAATCGRNFTPTISAATTRLSRIIGTNKIYRIASGASDGDTNWTTVLMAEAGKYMSGLSLHYYSLPIGTVGRAAKVRPPDFGEHNGSPRCGTRMDMEQLVNRHSAIMDKFDPPAESRPDRGRMGRLV